MWLGLAGVALAYFYHAPPLRLSYRGLGELAVAVAYGPLIVCGTYLVQRHTISDHVLLLPLPLGLLIDDFLWINEIPDLATDPRAGKRTLVVRLGRRVAGRVFAAIILLSFILLMALPLAGLPNLVLLGLAGFPHGAAAAKRLMREAASTRRLIPAQARTLASFLLMSLASGLGMLLSAS